MSRHAGFMKKSLFFCFADRGMAMSNSVRFCKPLFFGGKNKKPSKSDGFLTFCFLYGLKQFGRLYI